MKDNTTSKLVIPLNFVETLIGLDSNESIVSVSYDEYKKAIIFMLKSDINKDQFNIIEASKSRQQIIENTCKLIELVKNYNK